MMTESPMNNGQPDAIHAAEAATDTVGVDELQQRIEQLEQESASYKDQYLRAAAEMRNYKRRVEEDRANLIRNAGTAVLSKLLPILDDFDLAMTHAPNEVADLPWYNGVKLMYTKLQTVLEGEGVKPIEAVGAVFDPNQHEAVMHEMVGPDMAGRVTAELRRGYMLHDRVLRPSLVKVGEA
jgi:molecular chaperone GrpE